MRYYTELPPLQKRHFNSDLVSDTFVEPLDPDDVAPFSGEVVGDILTDVHEHVEETARYHDLEMDPDNMHYIMLEHGDTGMQTYMAGIYIRPGMEDYPVMILSDLIYDLDPEAYMAVVRHEIAHYEEYIRHGVKHEGTSYHKMYCEMLNANVTYEDALERFGITDHDFDVMHWPSELDERRKA